MHTVEVTFSNPRSKPEETPGIPLLDRQLSKEDPGISPKDPSKAISGANTSFLDITKQFVSAAEAIGLGKFIKEDGFSLFDAVGALEIGDSKMDSGFLEPDENFEHDYSVSNVLSANNVIWLMDELLCLEVAWLSGYPLSQTLFTSVYIDRLLWPEPRSLEEARFERGSTATPNQPLVDIVFRAYCVTLIRSCDLVHAMITKQHYYEEEDFASQLFHRELLRNIPVEVILANTELAFTWLSDASIEFDLLEAIHSRLLLRRNYLKILTHNSREPQSQGLGLKNWDHSVETLKRTAKLGSPIIEAFSVKIQRTLASSVPPRPMVRVEFKEAILYFQEVYTASTRIPEIFRINPGGDLLVAYWLYLSRNEHQSTYVRAVLQSLLNRGNKILDSCTTRDCILQDLRRFTLPGSPILDSANQLVEVPTDRRFQITKALHDFVDKVGPSFLSILRTICLNRCRIRRTLCHAIVEWDQLQAAAEDCDIKIQSITEEQPATYPDTMTETFSYPLSSWVYHYKLLQTEVLIQMGFELSVYAVDELYQMYWYLNYVCSLHLSHLDRIGFFVGRLKNDKTSVGKFKGHESEIIRSEADEAFSILFRNFNSIKATEALACALHKLYLVLGRHSSRVAYPQSYSSNLLRYELRMRPFLSLAVPEPLSYYDFETECRQGHRTDDELLDDAHTQTMIAKRAWDDVRRRGWRGSRVEGNVLQSGSKYSVENSILDDTWTKETKDILRACIATGIAISTVQQVLKQHNGRRTELQLKYEIPVSGERDYWHRWWVVPRIKA